MDAKTTKTEKTKGDAYRDLARRVVKSIRIAKHHGLSKDEMKAAIENAMRFLED